MTAPGTRPDPGHDPADQLKQRMEAFGREAQAAGDRFGRQAQAAGERWGHDPAIVAAGTWLTRLWGLVVLAVGLWFFASVTLGLDLPAIDWDVVWPAALILLGAIVLTTGLARRR